MESLLSLLSSYDAGLENWVTPSASGEWAIVRTFDVNSLVTFLRSNGYGCHARGICVQVSLKNS